MISKQNKLGGLFLAGAFLAVLILIGVGVAVLNYSLPYNFNDEQLSTEYLTSVTDYGEGFTLVSAELLPNGNPAEISEDSAIVYLAENESATQPDQISFIRVESSPEAADVYDQVYNAIAEESCEGENIETGTIRGNAYLEATCNTVVGAGSEVEFSYYLHGENEGEKWILFVTPEGESALKQLISQYISN